MEREKQEAKFKYEKYGKYEQDRKQRKDRLKWELIYHEDYNNNNMYGDAMVTPNNNIFNANVNTNKKKEV